MALYRLYLCVRQSRWRDTDVAMSVLKNWAGEEVCVTYLVSVMRGGADIVLKEKLVIYDYGNNRVGWEYMDCKKSHLLLQQ